MLRFAEAIIGYLRRVGVGMSYRALLLDIEGTTSSISFVKVAGHERYLADHNMQNVFSGCSLSLRIGASFRIPPAVTAQASN